MIEYVYHQDQFLSIIVRTEFEKDGIEFFTPEDFSQQLGYMKRPKKYIIPPHTHMAVPRQVEYTNEVLFIKRGKVRVDFYDADKNYLESRILRQGDVILLAYGGHGLEMLEESEIIEAKQGPYAGMGADKRQFTPVDSDKLKNVKD